MGVDLSILYSLASHNSETSGKAAEENLIEENRGIKSIQDKNEAIKRTYRKQIENIRKSEQLRAEILKGLSGREDIYTLFLKATKCIELMIGDTTFYIQSEDVIEKLYRGKSLEG